MQTPPLEFLNYKSKEENVMNTKGELIGYTHIPRPKRIKMSIILDRLMVFKRAGYLDQPLFIGPDSSPMSVDDAIESVKRSMSAGEVWYFPDHTGRLLAFAIQSYLLEKYHLTGRSK